MTNLYDHKGRRVRKTTAEAETTFLYDCWNLIYEREVSGAVTNEAWTVGGESAMLVRELDGQGRLVALAGRDGAPSPSVAYQRRFYSPGLGRWLNRDPIGATIARWAGVSPWRRRGGTAGA